MNHAVLQLRQGDVPASRVSDDIWDFIKSDFDKNFTVEELPMNESGAVTLIEGEATGHHHQISDVSRIEKSAVLRMKSGNREAFFLIKLKEPTDLRHYNVNTKELTKEHNTLELPAGSWLISGQRQFNQNSIVKVAD